VDWFTSSNESVSRAKFIERLTDYLVEFAQSEFKLSERKKDGLSVREHLTSVWKVTGRKPKELELLYLPSSLNRIWNWFCELSGGRQGMNPISWAEIKAWSDLTGNKPDNWQLSTIKAVDISFINKKNG